MPSRGYLEEMARASRTRAEAEMAGRSLADLEDLIGTLPPVRSVAARLAPGAGPAPRLVGEIVRRTPGGETLRADYQPRRIAAGFARVGAAALCVATEPRFLGGALEHLVDVRSAHLPALQHDVLVTPYQVAQARAAGADAVMLHEAALEGAALGLMLHAARRYGIETVAVAHDDEGVARAAGSGASMVCVRARDPFSWAVDAGALLRLAPRLPSGAPALAWGGLDGTGGIDRLSAAGYQAFMSDQELMRSADPGDALWRTTRS